MHILSIGYQLSLLVLFSDGLAEIILLEFLMIATTTWNLNYSHEDESKLRCGLHSLMIAANIPCQVVCKANDLYLSFIMAQSTNK